MALLSQVFKADDVEEEKPMPADNYLCEITKSSIKPTKAGDGKRLLLTIKIIDGEFDGSTLFEGLNIENPNPKAVSIAKRQLKELCEALGVEELEDTAELHGIPFTANIRVKEASNGWPARNEVKQYMNADVYDS